MGVAIIVTLCVLMNIYFCYNQHQLKKELTGLTRLGSVTSVQSEDCEGNHETTTEMNRIKVMI